jgi:hypothetical protein
MLAGSTDFSFDNVAWIYEHDATVAGVAHRELLP